MHKDWAMLRVSMRLFAAMMFVFTGISADPNEIGIEETAPAYEEIVPVEGWERFTGDSARSITGWVRLWRYLHMKKPIVMKWINNLVLRVYPCNEVFRALFVRGIYDPNPIVVMYALLPEGGTLIDVGANMGYISLLASKVVEPEGRIYAIEPSSRDFSRLVDNIRINGLDKIILPYRLAISEKVGQEKLLIAVDERSFLNTIGTDIVPKGVDKIGTEDVDASSIDEFVKRENIRRIDVLKLDIEGSELKALIGAVNTIREHRPTIILGVNNNALRSCNTDCIELQKMLEKMKYRIYKIVEKPSFALERITEDLSKANIRIIICLPEEANPPVLPHPAKRTIFDCIFDFFLR